MDIGSILPLLMQRQSGSSTDLSTLVQAFSGQQNGGHTDTYSQAGIQSLLANGGNDPAALLSLLKGGGAGGGSPNLNLVNLLSTLGKTRNTKKLHGLKPVKSFIPDKILGKMVKYFQ